VFGHSLYNVHNVVNFLSCRYLVVVDGKSCVFEKENDPRVLRYVKSFFSNHEGVVT